MSAIFVTGAGTEVGKTYVTCALIRALKQQGRAVTALKPIVSGFNHERDSDPGLILAALGEPLSPTNMARISPFQFRAPLAPNIAARREGREIDYADVLRLCREAIAAAPDVILIAGAGGIMSPVSDDKTFLDLIVDLNAPALIVGGSYLGAVSHMLTAVAAARSRRVAVKAGIVSESAPPEAGLDDTMGMLQKLDPATRYDALARNGTIDARVLA